MGSSSRNLFLVLSEATESEFVPTRSFRVNAGPVSSYCLCPGGKTRYLAELCAGDEVLCVSIDPSGQVRSRTAVVGRAKIERRPLVLVRAKTLRTTPSGAQEEAIVILQNAETVRLADQEGRPVSIANAAPDQRVLLQVSPDNARHVGMTISEGIIEK